MLGRGKAPHNAVRDALMHMVVQCGMADAAVVETPVTSADGSSTVADVVFLQDSGSSWSVGGDHRFGLVAGGRGKSMPRGSPSAALGAGEGEAQSWRHQEGAERSGK